MHVLYIMLYTNVLVESSGVFYTLITMCSQNHARHHRRPHHRFDHHRHPKCIQMSQDMWVRSWAPYFAIILLYFRHFPVIRHFPSFLVLFVCALCFPEVLQLRFCFSSISGHFWRVSVFPGGIMLLVPFSLVFWVVTSWFFLCQKQHHVRKHVANENNIIKDIIKYLNNITNIITNNMANNITSNSKPPASEDEEQYNNNGVGAVGREGPPSASPQASSPGCSHHRQQNNNSNKKKKQKSPEANTSQTPAFLYIIVACHSSTY